MLYIKEEHIEQIVSHALNGLPNEACGLLAGTAEGDVKRVEAVFELTNIDHSPEHFSMDPKEQFEVIKEIRSKGWQLLGNFHSHPATPSRPSAEDIRLAHDAQASYLILSLESLEKPILKGFRIVQGVVTEEEIMVC